MSLSNLKVNIDIINDSDKPSLLFSRSPKKYFDWDFSNYNKNQNQKVDKKHKKDSNLNYKIK